MNQLFNYFFSPLSKESCVYFLIISIFFFILFIGSLIWLMIKIIKGKNLGLLFYLNAIVILLNSLLLYFVNRLFFSMCSGSLH